ncbi:phosphotransferase [Bacillus sp. AFS001701]|uniref:phosphotransferase n=1 Tax=Bacillus sp. AFS001701 TaxID=2033480 RepID=UPI001596B5FA|nr:phosphotransferase [Bacillus sp. AFS001701]
MEKLIINILKQFPLSVHSIEIVKDFNIQKWHNDKHFKILVNNTAYSARFISIHRSNNDSVKIIEEQIIFTEFLVENRIPFMQIVKSRMNERFLSVLIDNQSYRFILFKWIDGIHINNFNHMITEKVGMMAAGFHETAARFKSNSFPKKSHLIAYEGFVNSLIVELNSTEILEENKTLLSEYLELTKLHINNAQTDQFEFIIQSDLNPLNIIWDIEDQTIKGIVDFESITYVDRIEGLAWIIKWYSKSSETSNDRSKNLTEKFMNKFSEHFQIGTEHIDRLSSLLWLSGCIN